MPYGRDAKFCRGREIRFRHPRRLFVGNSKIVAPRLNETDATRLLGVKLAYGWGRQGTRGTCLYASWEHSSPTEFIEICACGEESTIQLAGTTIHELAHCLGGPASGHGRQWKLAAKSLGLVRAQAAGQSYLITDFEPGVWKAIESLAPPSDGRPALPATRSMQPCNLGIGSRGGRSRGSGSGSRLRLFVCSCAPPLRIRVARDESAFRVRCLECGTVFRREPSAGSRGSAEYIGQRTK